MYLTFIILNFNHRVVDLQMIEDKADNEEYKNVEEFRADILTFVHNIIIFHGGKIILKLSFFILNKNVLKFLT